jgi:sugar phosphate isomerase/epimerase
LEKQCEFIACLCESVDCPTILVPAGIWLSSLGEKPSWQHSYDLQKENLIFLAGIFERSGISVAVEPVGGADFSFTKLKEADELIQDCRFDTIGIAPDIHLQVCADDKPEDLKSLNSPITLFHLDDTLDLPGKVLDIQKDRTFPGEGIGRSSEWVSAALDTGYSGYFSLELFSSSLASLPADEAVDLCFRKATEFSESYYKSI